MLGVPVSQHLGASSRRGVTPAWAVSTVLKTKPEAPVDFSCVFKRHFFSGESLSAHPPLLKEETKDQHQRAQMASFSDLSTMNLAFLGCQLWHQTVSIHKLLY